jgi:3',5'-cyclic AMP phosphodiesterase CpdA
VNEITRRIFIKTMAAGFALCATGCSQKIAWPIRGSEKGRLRFAFFTDVHARTEWNTPDALNLAAEAIGRSSVDLVLSGGDLITDGFQSSAQTLKPRWDAYMKMHGAIKAEHYPALGNHDLVAALPEDGTLPAENPRSIFLSKLGLEQTYYSFDALGYHFIILDSVLVTGDEYKYHGMIWPEEREWLKRDLANVDRTTPIVVVTHIPLLTSFFGATQGATFAAEKNRVVINNREILTMFENRNLVLVLQGHLHIKEMLMWRDTAFITGGAVCGKWWRGPWFGTEEGFNIVTLTGNRVRWEYIDYGWNAIRP